MKKLPHPSQPEGPVSVRMSSELQKQLDVCAQKTGLKVTDLMRLCLRIGIEHFSRIDYDTAKCIVDTVERTKSKASLSKELAHEELDEIEQEPCADTAPSTGSFPAQSPTQQKDVNIVQLPPPPVIATLLHDTLKAAETTTTLPVAEQRQDVIYQKPTRKKK